jgi:hypothetical protein
MKNIIILFTILLSYTAYSQCSTYRPPVQHTQDYSILLSVNYGTKSTLGLELSLRLNNNILGVGYAGYLASNANTMQGDIDTYQVSNQAVYLTYGRKISNWVVSIKYGKQNNAHWNKVMVSPSSYTFEKQLQKYSTMVATSVGYCISNKVMLNVGADTFSNATMGFTLTL